MTTWSTRTWQPIPLNKFPVYSAAVTGKPNGFPEDAELPETLKPATKFVRAGQPKAPSLPRSRDVAVVIYDSGLDIKARKFQVPGYVVSEEDLGSLWADFDELAKHPSDRTVASAVTVTEAAILNCRRLLDMDAECGNLSERQCAIDWRVKLSWLGKILEKLEGPDFAGFPAGSKINNLRTLWQAMQTQLPPSKA